MEKGEQETEGAHGGGIWHLSGSRVGGGFNAPPPPAEGHPSHRSRWSCHDTMTLPWQWWPQAGQPRTFKTHTYFFLVNLFEGSGGHFVCAVCSSSVQKCQRPAHCCWVFFFLLLSSGSWMEEGQLTRQGRQTNKQTEGIKIEKNRADETWRCVFIAVRLMACSSHYSLLCPLPPIGCNNTAWQGCQCHVISCFCLTTWTTRATSHQDGFFVFLLLR